MQQRLKKMNFCNSRVREGPAGRQLPKPRPEPLTPAARSRSAPRGPGRTRSRERPVRDGPGDAPSSATAPQYPYARGNGRLTRRPPSTPSRWPRWPRSRPPHLRVRRHPAGADSGTASGALPGHSAGPRGRARPGARQGRAWRPRAGRRAAGWGPCAGAGDSRGLLPRACSSASGPFSAWPRGRRRS